MRIVRHYEHGAPSVLRVEEAEKPQPGPGEVLIRSEAVGVTFAEVQRRQGIPIGGHATLPGAPGGDVAGVVEAVGEGVTNLSAGDRVVVDVDHSAYADYVTADAAWAITIPDTMDAAEATLLPSPAQTAYHAIKEAGQLRAGESILIDAASGGVGHLAVQIAKAMGAGKVIATASTQAKLDFVRDLGADVTVNYTDDDWDDQVRAATDGRGVDVVLETVGGDILTKSIALTAQFGRLVFYGSASGDIQPIHPLMLSRMKTVAGFALYAMLYNKPEAIAAGQRDLLDMIATGKVRPVVHERLGLDEAVKAHELMEARAQLGKVVLVP
ncbi:zinc-binding dehydrogenase [Streptomyces collinus]|uniref:Zinc-binding dehydrogenase n=1 Tax=Streptomyces violaceochromogenes TaxID=67377 RepID=A0ABU6M1U7_9ACTN|nr:zinc-binding dehydrogenase [Streptomyces violaceochromogenes]MEC7055542.1 zinc-binding dehydrogenase [Streptomyces violaceochromogenes]GHC73830.1 oxidoreductase [Streptomyces violaceochromogenes]